MAVRQVVAPVQNGGNYCQLNVQDQDFGGSLIRIEVSRCSQPADQYGVTAAGTRVQNLAGVDHLKPTSNRVSQHVFSVGSPDMPKITRRIREIFDEVGSWEPCIRDTDPESKSFGRTLVA